MGIQGATIYLDNQWSTYYTGQPIVGRIEYMFDSPKTVRGITVQFKGQAHTEFYERRDEQNSETGKTETREVIHYGDEEYFNSTQYILGNQTGGEIVIPSGKQVYNFTYTLPSSIPSSFEGKHGYIRYTVKITLDRPWKFNQETKMAFTVINVLDLNLNPSYRQPLHFQFEKKFCCFCCTSGPLSIDVRAPVSGYCAGQLIPFNIDVDNKSNVDIQLIKIYFRKVVMYRATTPVSAHKKVEDVLTTLSEGPAPAGTTKQWTLSLQIPTIPPSNLVNCNIMDLDYDIKVECVVTGAHMNLRDKKYVTIGTVPLVGVASAPPAPAVQAATYPSPSPAELPVAPGTLAQPTPAAPGDAGWMAPGTAPTQLPHQNLYPALMMPVYKQSEDSASTIQDSGDTEYTKMVGPQNFAPHYPTYSTVPPPLPQ